MFSPTVYEGVSISPRSRLYLLLSFSPPLFSPWNMLRERKEGREGGRLGGMRGEREGDRERDRETEREREKQTSI